MKRLVHFRSLGITALFLGLALSPGYAAAQGEESHETKQNQDGTWTQTDIQKDGSKKETKMDKDLHKTKETEWDEKGHKFKDSDWEWNKGEKCDVKRVEHFYGADGDENFTVWYDENAVRERSIGWIDGVEIVDTYKGGVWVRREKKVGGKIIKVETPESRAAENAKKMLVPPPVPPTFSPDVSLNGIVLPVPDRFAPGEPINFKIVKLTGEVVAGEPVRISNSIGEVLEAKSDSLGNVSVQIPTAWTDARIDSLGLSVMTYASTHNATTQVPTMLPPPPFIQPGHVCTLHGDGFRPNLAANTVSFGKAQGIVLGATPNALIVLVPADLAPGLTPIRITTGGESTRRLNSTTIDLTLDPGPSTLLAGQRVTRTLRVVGTEQQIPVRIDDPKDDAATITNAEIQTSSGGKNNIVNLAVTGTRQGSFSAQCTVVWAKIGHLQPTLTNAESAAKNGERCVGESNMADYFAQGEDTAKWKKAATEWAKAAVAWRDATHAWEDGDEKKAKAAEARAKTHEAAARGAVWRR